METEDNWLFRKFEPLEKEITCNNVNCEVYGYYYKCYLNLHHKCPVYLDYLARED